MSRLSRPLIVITLAISTTPAAFATTTIREGRGSEPPSIVALHLAEAAGQRQKLASLSTSRSWAPDLGPSAIDVLHYTLDLHLDATHESLSGTAEVEIEVAAESLGTIELDADQGLRVLGVLLIEDLSYSYDGIRSLSFTHTNDRLSVQLHRVMGQGERVRLMISYGGRAGYWGGGVSWDGSVIHTFAEPFGSRLWWPCNDRPDDKATVDLTVTAPSWMVVSSNGLETGRVEHANGTATTSWSSRYPVATYLVVMNASDYEVSELTYNAQDGSTMPVVTYAYPDLADDAEADLAVTPEMITALANRFGEYPFVEEKYGNCLTPFGGGMEHQTLTTISANAIGGDGIDWLNSHELGHQWWGDWVSPDDWRELWLNEGFATYSEIVWAEHVGPDTLAAVVEGMDWRGYFLDTVYDNPTPFSSTVYEKGSWVLRMLRRVLGDDAFFAAIVEYRETFGGGSATTVALQAILEDHAGQDLDWFFQQWVYGVNRPRYRYSWSEVEGPAVRLVVTQEHSNAPLFRMPMDVAITTSTGAESAVVWLEAEAEQTIDIQVGASPSAVVLDPEHHVLCELGPASDPDLDLGEGYPSFDAGTLLGGESAMLTIPLNNVGGSDLVISAIYPWFADSFEVVAPTQLPLTIAPGESAQLELRYTASGVRLQSDLIIVESNDPSRDGATLIRTEGTSVSSNDPFLSAPPLVRFDDTPVGGSTEVVLDLANEGNAPLEMSTLITGDFELATTLPDHLGPIETIPMTVRFAPTEVGMLRGSLVFTSNDPLRPERTVPLLGTGVAAPAIAVDPPAVLFGLTDEPITAAVTLTSTGLTDLEVSEVAVGEPFELAEGLDLPAVLAPGETLSIPVRFHAGASGTVRSSLRVLSNDPTLPWATVPFQGHMTGAGIVAWAYPAVTRADGLGGASWSSDAVLLNPTDADLAVDLRFLAAAKGAAGPPAATVTVPAGQQRTIADVVSGLGRDGNGGLLVWVNAPGLVATSRTFAGGDDGTHGQYIAAVAEADVLVGGAHYILPGLAANDGFHTNFGVLNLGADTVTVEIEVFAADGTSPGTVSIAAGAGSFAQRSAAIGDLTGDVVRGGYAIVTCGDDSATYLAYASSVDDASHDPTFVAPQALGGGGALDAIVPVVASTPGSAGTVWRSQVTVVNRGDGDAEVEMELRGDASEPVIQATRTIPSGGTFFSDDIISELDILDVLSTGWMRIISATSGLHVASRTYNDDPAGTYGQNVLAVSADAVLGADDTVALSGLSSADGFRTNLGITSLAPEPTSYRVDAYTEDGRHIGQVTVSVPAQEAVQVLRILGSELGYNGRAWLTVTTDDPDAAYAVHASVVDGATGDATYVPGVAMTE